jgi:hypothetical protein
LCNVVPRTLADVPVVEIRRYARHAFRYMDAYWTGLIGKTVEVAIKKYRSRRRIPRATLENVD